ncbi:MAG TPA: DPP IV N-terminal domain-containing protein, partial [Flavobacteriales bacterium]
MRTTLFLVPALVLGITANAQKPLTNQEIWYSPAFSSERVDGLLSMKDGIHYTTLEEEGGTAMVNQYAYKTGDKVGTVVNGKDLVLSGATAPLPMEGYSFSGDEQRLMIESGMQPLYRYSYFAYNHVYDRSSKKLMPLSDPAKSPQRLATFSPDGSHAAFVRDNNLYTVELATMKETAVTTDGEWNKVLNGATDWVYEEEFTLVQGYQWSPDGKKILFLRSDESGVREFDFTTYRHELYPGSYKFKYPKAGEANSTVSLHIHDVASHTTAPLDLGTTETDLYLPRFGFIDREHVWFMRMDRLQQTKTIQRANITVPDHPGKPTEIYSEKSDTYVEVTDDLFFLANGGFILTSEKSGWNHIHWHDPS